jgi:hypothetical protein
MDNGPRCSGFCTLRYYLHNLTKIYPTMFLICNVQLQPYPVNAKALNFIENLLRWKRMMDLVVFFVS